MLDAEAAPACVVSIHAHPDDEASKGAPTMARYRTQGVRTVLITCTGGEAGEILNPAADTPAARADLGKVRMAELDEAVRIIGYDALYLLGYRDSGMADSEANADPRNFANADLDEAVGRIVRILRVERPQVVLTYGDDSRGGYSHPDHLRVHETSLLAFDRAGDPDWYPDAGDPWQPLKLYYSSGFTRRRLRTMHEWLLNRGEESPFGEWIARMEQDGSNGEDETTTRIEVSDFLEVGREALLAHRTQVAPDSIFFSMPLDVARELHPWDEYVLARSLVETSPVDGEYETDLFAGIQVRTGS
jgi:mycothiol S-conjugate amidase